MSELTPLMSFIERAAREPDFDLHKFESLLRLQREAEQEQARRAFNADMAEVQNEIGDIARSGKNPSFNNPYAKLEDLDREARPIYTGHGFSVRYGSALSSPNAPPLLPGNMRMVLIISHRNGFIEEHHLDGPLDTQSGARARTAIQAVGSTVTYLRRYLLQMVLNLVPAGDPSDDDGDGQRRREAINREVPMPQPAGNGRDPWVLWLETLDNEAAKLADTAAWDAFWSRNAVKRAFGGLQGEHLARLEAIQQRHRERLFPAPSDDDLPEVKIAGEEKLAGG